MEPQNDGPSIGEMEDVDYNLIDSLADQINYTRKDPSPWEMLRRKFAMVEGEGLSPCIMQTSDSLSYVVTSYELRNGEFH